MHDAHHPQYHHLRVILNQLQDHLRESDVDVPNIEGHSSNFMGKQRLMRRLALEMDAAKRAEGGEGGFTVCEVGFNAGHSTLLWLTAGATKVLSFELGQVSVRLANSRLFTANDSQRLLRLCAV